MAEIDLSRKLIDLWPGHSEKIEPSFGMSGGIPDVMLWGPTGATLPVELKVAESYDGKRLVSRKIRPAQISWHLDFPHRSVFLWHLPDRGKNIVSARDAGTWLYRWKEGIQHTQASTLEDWIKKQWNILKS